MSSKFEWHPDKAKSNLAKRTISFEEASTVFDDALLVTFLDEAHSIDENRFITIGLSGLNRLLLVAHTDHEGRIRIISARKVTNHERKFYEAGL